MYLEEACMAILIGDEMTDKKKNFRHDYTDYETLEEAEKFAKRSTARNLSVNSVWQRVKETVVPEVEVLVNPVDVTVVAVA
jgi:hypothetical protein